MSSPATELRLLSAEREWGAARRAWRPPETIPLSDWLDANFVPSDTQGFWKTLPFQRGIADAMSDPEIESVSVLKSARVGFTKIVVGYICYRIATDPCGILVVQPAGEDAEGFSKEDIAPGLEATAAVRGLVADPKARDSDNTILSKRFPGGFLKVVGAHSGRGFRRITTELVVFEETDAYPPSAGSEGDQIELGKKRAHTAAFPKFISGSSPKLKATSRIVPLFEEGDQRDRIVPCPHCDHGQRLQWGGRDVDYGIKWPDGRPRDAYYLCAHCHERIEHHHLGRMDEQGIWTPARPDVKGHASFRIWAGYSPFPKAAWGVLAEEWLAVKDDALKRQVFINTVLGEAYEERGRSPKLGSLLRRREPLPSRETGRIDAQGQPEVERLVPRGSLILTSMTDVQLDRLEVGVEGWGLGYENWKLEYHVLYGDPSAATVWEELYRLLARPRALERGGYDFIRSSCVDSGYSAQAVYAFVAAYGYQDGSPGYTTHDGGRAFLWATKGVSGTGNIWTGQSLKNKAWRVPVYPVHVDAAKDLIYARTEKAETPAQGLIHFGSFLTDDYFRQYQAEHAVDKRDKKGFPFRQYEIKAGHRRNEALDIAVGNLAALCALEANGASLEIEAKRLPSRLVYKPPQELLSTPVAPHEMSGPAPVSASQPRRDSGGGGWLGDTSGWLR